MRKFSKFTHERIKDYILWFTKFSSAEKEFEILGNVNKKLFLKGVDKSEEEELGFMVKEIRRQAELIKKDKSLSDTEREKPFNNIAVLVRKRKQILKVIDAFLQAGIPYATDGEEDIRGEKRVRQMLDVLELASVDIESTERKSLVLYRVLTSEGKP